MYLPNRFLETAHISQYYMYILLTSELIFGPQYWHVKQGCNFFSIVYFKKSTAVFVGANKKSKLRYEVHDAICPHHQRFIVTP